MDYLLRIQPIYNSVFDCNSLVDSTSSNIHGHEFPGIIHYLNLSSTADVYVPRSSK